jgi:hypothetical protein
LSSASADQVAQADCAADELVEWRCLDSTPEQRREQTGDLTAVFRVAHGCEHACAYRDLNRVLIPAARRVASAGSERQYELLAGGAEPTGGSVEAVENNLLDRGIEAAPGKGVRAARVG